MRTPTISALSCGLLASFALVATSVPSSAGTVTIAPDKDNTIFSESGATSNGAGEYLFTGRTAQGALRRALLHFDVASAVPSGATITSATLTLNMSQTIAGAQVVRIFRVGADWGEGTSDAPNQEGTGTTATPGDATWTDRFFGVSTWTNVGGDFAPQVSASRLVDQFQTYTWGPTQNMANDVQLWLNNPAQNFGWIVIGNEASGVTAKRFDSSEHLGGQGPVLTIDFTAPCVPSSYCTASPSSVGAPGVLANLNQPLISNGVFQLQATSLPANVPCTFYFGDLRTETPLGNGIMCVTGTLRRFGTVLSNGSGVASRSLVLSAPPGTVVTPLSTWCFQAQFRDPSAGGFNQTQALAVTFCP